MRHAATVPVVLSTRLSSTDAVPAGRNPGSWQVPHAEGFDNKANRANGSPKEPPPIVLARFGGSRVFETGDVRAEFRAPLPLAPHRL